MKIKLSELLSKREALSQITSKELPATASYKLSRSLRLINTEMTEYDKVRNDLIKKHGKADEKGGATIGVGTPEMEAFLKDLEPILEEEVELDIQPVSIKLLGEDFKLEIKHMSELIDFIIKD